MWRIIILIVIVASISLFIVHHWKKLTTTLPTTIMMSGSTSLAPLAEALAMAYMKENPKVKITVGAGGSTVGIVQTQEKVVDIGMSSRELKPKELEYGLHVIPIAMDGIAVIVHPSNQVENLTIERIREIYAGKITNWYEVGGPKAEIHVITREEGSGTRGAFEELVMKEEKISLNAITQGSTGVVKATVAGDPLAIGYISFAAFDETVKALSIGGVKPTIEEMKAKKYPLVRPFLFLTAEEPKDVVKDFIDFVLGEKGQQIVAAEGCIPVR